MADYPDFALIPEQSYGLIYCDPPWIYTGDQAKMAAAGKHYQLMPDLDLAAMPVKSKCQKRAVILMWATCPRLDAAIDLMRAWGFYYRGVAFVWIKTRKDGGIIGAQGVRPSIVKPTTELLLAGSASEEDDCTELLIAGSTVKTGRPLPLSDEGVAQVVLAPRTEHSAKPYEVRKRIERLYGPSIPKLEMFARGIPVAGWDRFGNELDPEPESLGFYPIV